MLNPRSTLDAWCSSLAGLANSGTTGRTTTTRVTISLLCYQMCIVRQLAPSGRCPRRHMPADHPLPSRRRVHGRMLLTHCYPAPARPPPRAIQQRPVAPSPHRYRRIAPVAHTGDWRPMSVRRLASAGPEGQCQAERSSLPSCPLRHRRVVRGELQMSNCRARPRRCIQMPGPCEGLVQVVRYATRLASPVFCRCLAATDGLSGPSTLLLAIRC